MAALGLAQQAAGRIANSSAAFAATAIDSQIQAFAHAIQLPDSPKQYLKDTIWKIVFTTNIPIKTTEPPKYYIYQ
jgi:hypothetical protein